MNTVYIEIHCPSMARFNMLYTFRFNKDLAPHAPIDTWNSWSFLSIQQCFPVHSRDRTMLWSMIDLSCIIEHKLSFVFKVSLPTSLVLLQTDMGFIVRQYQGTSCFRWYSSETALICAGAGSSVLFKPCKVSCNSYSHRHLVSDISPAIMLASQVKSSCLLFRSLADCTCLTATN